QGALDIVRVVPALERLEMLGQERLGADADTIDSARGEHRHELGSGRFRVALNGELPALDAKQTGGSAPDEDGLQGPGVRGQGSQLIDQAINERRLLIAGVHERV